MAYADGSRPTTSIIGNNMEEQFAALAKSYLNLAKSRQGLMHLNIASYEREAMAGYWGNAFSEFFANRLMVLSNNYPPASEKSKQIFLQEFYTLQENGPKHIAKFRELVAAIPNGNSNEIPYLRGGIMEALDHFQTQFDSLMQQLGPKAGEMSKDIGQSIAG